MVSGHAKVTNASGLHARPAAEFVKAAKAFQSCITIRKSEDGQPVNAKSIAQILCEGIVINTDVEISAQGPDEREAVNRLIALIGSGFGE